VKNGVPFDVAHALMRGGPEGQAEAYAMAIIFGEFEGGQFDFETGRWKQPG
jgi:hypothetical protein